MISSYSLSERTWRDGTKRGREIGEERRRRILGVLAEERERASAEHKRYKEELGLKN